MRLVFKIVDSHDWQAAIALGAYAGAPIDIQDGYIHLSAEHQVKETAKKHFNNRKNLLLVAYRADDLGKELLWEPSRGGDLFPHCYAPLPTTLALWVRPLPLDETGAHLFPELA